MGFSSIILTLRVQFPSDIMKKYFSKSFMRRFLPWPLAESTPDQVSMDICMGTIIQIRRMKLIVNLRMNHIYLNFNPT